MQLLSGPAGSWWQQYFGPTQQTIKPGPFIMYWNSLFFPLLFYINQRIPVIYNSLIHTAKVAVTQKQHCYYWIMKKNIETE